MTNGDIDPMRGKRLETIIFDLGGVVCHFDPESRLRNLGAESGLTPAEVGERLDDLNIFANADCGKHTVSSQFSAIANALEIDCTFERFRTLWCSAFTPEPLLLSIAKKIRSDRTTAILSNNDPIIAEGFGYELSALNASFDHLFLSWEFGSTKPSIDLFRAVQHQLGVEHGSILLVGDSAANVGGARQAGWLALSFQGVDQLVADLHCLGVL